MMKPQKTNKKYKIVQQAYLGRIARSLLYASIIILVSLLIGVTGYHYFAHLPWVDSLLNASMILTGMGPVDPMKDTVGKVFASLYSLFSGIVFLSSIAVFISPIIHQFMYQLHVEEDSDIQESIK
jgi:hypothetical protein